MYSIFEVAMDSVISSARRKTSAVTTLIIRDLDDRLGHALKREARRRQLSVNRLVHQLIAQGLQKPGSTDEKGASRNDLARFAGRWSATDLKAFQMATRPFAEIEHELWQ